MEGAKVWLVDRKEPELASVCAGIRDRGGIAEPYVADLTITCEVEKMVNQAAETFGGLDIVVNNAYTGPYKKLLDQDDEGWQQGIAIGLTAAMVACRTAIPFLQQRGGGSLINLGSINSFKPGGNMAVYSAVKGGIVNLSRQIAVTYGESGIRCNALCPGFITHDQRNENFAKHPLELERVLATIPVRRLGVGEDIANAALFLASDESTFVTGHSLVVDGGSTIQNANVPTHYFEKALRASLEE